MAFDTEHLTTTPKLTGDFWRLLIFGTMLTLTLVFGYHELAKYHDVPCTEDYWTYCDPNHRNMSIWASNIVNSN